MVKLKGVVVFRHHLALHSSVIYIVLAFVGYESKEGLEVLAKGLEYALVTTELAAKTCHDTSSGKRRLCLRSNLSHVS